MGQGAVAGRVGLKTSIFAQIANFSGDFAEMFGPVNLSIISRGITHGAKIVTSKPIFLIIAMLSSIFFGICQHKQVPKTKRFKEFMILGALLFILPLLPCFLISGHSLSLRNIFPSLLGLGIILDLLTQKIPVDFSGARQIISACLVFLFIIIGASETADYRAVHLADEAYVKGLEPQLIQEYLYIKRAEHLAAVGYTYNEHIISVTSSGWALTGAARAITGNVQIPMIAVPWGE
jgi:hypothetical protein